MKHIVYNLNSIRPPITGIGRYAIELLRGNLRTNIQSSAVHNGNVYKNQSIPEMLDSFEQPTTSLGMNKPLSLSLNQNYRQLIGNIPWSREIYRYLNSKRFTHLANSSLAAGAIYHDINYSPLQNAPRAISTVYDLSHQQCPDTHPHHRVRYLNRYFKQLAVSDNPVITISESIKNELIQSYELPAERIHVTHLAADECFRPHNKAEAEAVLSRYSLNYKQYLLSVGTLEPRKNLTTILTAYSTLDESIKQAFPLVIVGPQGWKSKPLEEQIDQLHKQGHIIKIGFVPQQQLPALYASAAAFVYPSIYEGFGLPLLEAMQSGCPCITSNAGSLAEVAKQHALKVNPLDGDDLASKITKLLQDTQLNSHYSIAALKRAADFSWDQTIRQTHKVYDSI